MAVGGAVLVAALLVAVVRPSHAGRTGLSGTEQTVRAAINEVRTEHGLEPVQPDATLTRAARSHSDEMVAEGYFGHRVFWKRLDRFGVPDGNVGENLGWDVHLGDAVRELVSMWLKSPDHRGVLLSGKYDEVGIGVTVGPFKGFPQALVVTTDFYGKP
jgi:uncharacterized protein YkwD